MFEEYAIQYYQLPGDQLRLVAYGLAIIGGIIGGATNRSTAELRRAPYFALTGLMFFGTVVVSFAEVLVLVRSIAGGYLWGLVVVDLFTAVGGGFFIARIAIARSRDAHGHGRMAPLAFVAFANFWLLLGPSANKDSASPAPTIRLLTGGLGVLSGFVLLAAAISLGGYVKVEAVRRVEAAQAAGVFDDGILAQALALTASKAKTPAKIDDTTTLIRMEAEGLLLRYVYEVDSPAGLLPVDLQSADARLRLEQWTCSYKVLGRAIDAGAVIRHEYLRKDGSEIGAIEVTRKTCGL